jgi:hypothetical protein
MLAYLIRYIGGASRQGRIQDFLKGGAKSRPPHALQHNLSVHCDLSQPPQVMHKVWKLLLCLEMSWITIAARKMLSLISALTLNDVRFMQWSFNSLKLYLSES